MRKIVIIVLYLIMFGFLKGGEIQITKEEWNFIKQDSLLRKTTNLNHLESLDLKFELVQNPLYHLSETEKENLMRNVLIYLEIPNPPERLDVQAILEVILGKGYKDAFKFNFKKAFITVESATVVINQFVWSDFTEKQKGQSLPKKFKNFYDYAYNQGYTSIISFKFFPTTSESKFYHLKVSIYKLPINILIWGGDFYVGGNHRFNGLDLGIFYLIGYAFLKGLYGI